MNTCRTPKIQPLLVNNVFILDCKEKTKLFNDFCSNQCRLIANNCVLPTFNFLTDKRIDQISIKKDEIVYLVRNLNPNKASGSDGISGQMLFVSDDLVGMPLKIIFENILISSLYPDVWKLANVTPILKKGDKQSIINYGLIFKLKQNGISGGLLQLFENYLSQSKLTRSI